MMLNYSWLINTFNIVASKYKIVKILLDELDNCAYIFSL